jgi:predicted glycosyl hydrolase (DUF1957 family)
MEVDNEMQRRMAIDRLLRSEGFKYFMEELKNLMETNQADLDKMQKSVVSQQKLCELNFALGENKAYDRVNLVLLTFKEELENSPVTA